MISPTKSRRLVTLLAAAGLLAGGLAYLVSHDPSTPGSYPSCLFHELTGLHCPGCGSTRAAYALLHGDLLLAIHRNALAVLLLPVLAGVVLVKAAAFCRGRTVPELAPPPGTAKAVLWLVLAFWLLRNLPMTPFSALAPT